MHAPTLARRAVDPDGRPIAYADLAVGLLQLVGVDPSGHILTGEPCMRSRPDPRALALLACLALASCTEDQVSIATDTDDTTATSGTTGEPTTDPSTSAAYPGLDERPCPEDSVLTAENFGAPFMLTHCTGCHHVALEEGERADAPLGVDFESLTRVRQQAAAIWARAADQNATMPPVGPPSADERARLGEWLACGAPPPRTCDPVVVDDARDDRALAHAGASRLLRMNGQHPRRRAGRRPAARLS